MLRAFSNLFQTCHNLRFRIILPGNVGKTNDRIHRCSNIMGHIIQENSFCTAGIFCITDCVLKGLIDFLLFRPVRQVQNIFLCSLNVCAEYDHTEPQHLTGFLMDILSVPLTLLSGLNFRQLI